MPTFETFATRFARCLELFRDPGAKADQKTEFRAILGLLTDAPVTLRLAAGQLEINGVPCEGAEAARLLQRLELHGIAEVALPQNPPAPQLFELLRALADPPGTEDIPARLRAAGVDQLSIVLSPGVGSSPAAPSPPQEDFRAREAMTPAADQPSGRTSRSLGTDGILRGESWSDIQSVPIAGVPFVTHDPPPPPAANALPGEAAAASPPPPSGGDELSLSIEPRRGSGAVGRPPGPERPPAAESATPARASAKAPRGGAAPTPTPTPSTTPPGLQGVAGEALGEGIPITLAPSVDAALAELERNPSSPGVGDVLAALVRHVETALKQNRLERLLAIVLAISRSEPRVPEASGMRRQYAIALKRIYTKPVLDALTRLIAAPKHRADAITALQRGGADAVEVLMDLLVTAPTVGERRGVFDALKAMTEGTEQLVHMLDHPEWFVARNVAELLGELGMEDAVPALARQLDHADERVRKAVALALAKIGTRSAAEPLRRALRDKSAEVRMQVALGIGGRKSFALAMPLVVAMAEEQDETVERELILALGRIGSPDAVQALIKFGQPAGRFFGRKPSGRRLAAVEALRLAGTPAAVGTLEGLADDGDRQVRGAARAALEELKRKPRPA
jgi:HEAT repeat protein/PBS lyase HEAT-like repeat-containing protein